MSSKRAGGRRARQAARAPEAIRPNPAPPGQRGGQYRPLSRAGIEAIYATACDLLGDLGMGETPPGLAERAVAAGAEMRGNRLCFPKALIEDIVDGAAKTLVLHGRDPARDLEIGGDRVYFGTGGAAVQVLDLQTRASRASTLADLADFTRLQDALPNISWFTRCVVAGDMAEITDLDINTAFALLAHTDKPVGTSFTVAETVDPIVDMFDVALGGEGRFAARPFCKAHISPVISPMRFGADAVAVTEACIRRRVPINGIIAAQSGATAPAAPAGFLAQSLAETLATLAMVNLTERGYPMIFSNWPLVIDLRTGAFSGGGPESALMNAASAQIINWLGLPSGVAAGMADAKPVDAQMGTEKAMTLLATGLSGANMVYESAGMTAALLGASLEAMVLDDEAIGQVHRILRGIEVTAETLDTAPMQAAILGEGHFLGSPATMAAMERDYLHPALADRDPPVTWAEQGQQAAADRARAKVRQILASHHPTYLSTKAEADLRNRHRIFLTPGKARAGG
ncbi:MAG: trimethylamine methyltransferase family protein [Pseudomonadota bacterium]